MLVFGQKLIQKISPPQLTRSPDRSLDVRFEFFHLPPLADGRIEGAAQVLGQVSGKFHGRGSAEQPGKFDEPRTPFPFSTLQERTAPARILLGLSLFLPGIGHGG